jgi:hypothetical protein
MRVLTDEGDADRPRRRLESAMAAQAGRSPAGMSTGTAMFTRTAPG